MKINYILMALALYLCISHAKSKSHCVGTCYSGGLFPEPQDIFHGKHLKGHSYNNITTKDAARCYSSCVQDCRCKACQMKDATCELLDEDKTSKADDFKDEPGYVYFDLKQTMYQGKSHMVPSDVSCYNGCCRSQPCMNGGTCVEHCKSPKEKFSCKCPSVWYHGKLCENKYPATSCLQVLNASIAEGKFPADGTYPIMRGDKLTIRVMYCAFVRPNKAWGLMESFSLANNKRFESFAFYDYGRENAKQFNWQRYRLPFGEIEYHHGKSTMFRITCDFPNRRGILTPDYLLGYLRDYDILKYGHRRCYKFAHINIRGHNFFNISALPHQLSDRIHFHIECGQKSCDLDVPGHLEGENCFGWYKIANPESKCTEKPESTTQFWLGAEL